MKIIRARTAGFCMGVSLALRKLDREVTESNAPIATLGPIIHNPQVMAHYEERGVRCLRDTAQVVPGQRVVIRAHGIPVAEETALNATGASVVDATCPKVKRAQLGIAEERGRGGTLLLFGEADHPEVRGLLSYAGEGAMVFGSLDELKGLALHDDTAYFLAAQTTQDRAAFEDVVSWLRQRLGREIPVLQTICDATRKRQQEAVDIARRVQAMVVVGGFDSGNTRRLADVARAQGVFTVHVETVDQLPVDELRKKSVIGLTAGASTPKSLIDAVQRFLESL
ncbi:4-hydroxy-3-methylbut-2-enyl diphosphate reductase [Nitratidesulfovibrio liaohensis]|uniref:4-hydroxy-3-methylbut-2-enyl diphosphate reductase n=1 Tax=Nitratidesulfovibrio liaohensis TaxID=2604158 RepID=A0ABY9R0I6_9BACT|nr:4-hydroxy-3-methylbut-2-enyl diphosphate reductase [Nitratidesulfovibrio liaohensis]WMW64259.1 4-hydroxy-3-methylbut-2-enyl diphosphate reductase [Nitratidesulfovibrio liaohensis]